MLYNIALHHATTDLKFGSCTALSSSSPVIEALKSVPVEVESRSQTPSLRLRRRQRCGLYCIADLLPHAPLELCSYWECGQVFITIIFSQSTVLAAVCVSAWVCHCVLWWRYVLTSVHSIGRNSIEAKGAVSIAEAMTKTPNLQQFKLGYVIITCVCALVISWGNWLVNKSYHNDIYCGHIKF